VLIKRLLILVLLCCCVAFATTAQQPSVRPASNDSLAGAPGSPKQLADTLKPTSDSAKRIPGFKAKIVDSLKNPSDTGKPASDSAKPAPDSSKLFPDSLKAVPSILLLPDSLKAVPSILPLPDYLISQLDSLYKVVDLPARASDSLRRVPDSPPIAAGSLPTPANAFKPRTDSLKPIPDSSILAPDFSRPTVDSLKLHLDSMLALATSSARPNQRLNGYSQGPPGSPTTILPPGAPASPVYSPSMGSSPVPAPADSLKAKTGNPLAYRPGQKPPIAPGLPPGFISSKRTAPALSNLHRKYIPVRPGIIHIDSVSLVPGAFLCKDIGDSAYTLDWLNATLSWKHPPPGIDSVLILYRTFPYRLNAVAKRFNYDSIESYFLVSPYDLSRGSKNGNDDFFSFGNINYNGSFGRSITFGNSQDAVVTSNLNLQISGYLADSIEISAAITDNNIPIQPDGTTADLNEFDKIFLQFKKKNWALTMGDIDLRQNQNYFLNFYKRLQGASFETSSQATKNFTNKTLVSAAIAKGKFTRNIFQGLEGNQGPYKLQGADNELFFIVLAGTEKVYIDGQLMARGGDQDYTINYNTAEVTFTANRMITQDARIQVEFEYADRNYLNVNLYLYDEAMIDNKLKLRLGLFSNSDSRNSPIDQTLTPDQNKFLSKLGDSIQRAFYPVANLDTLAPGKILYKKVDTTYKNAAGVVVHDSAFIFSTDPTVALYNLSFANVGQGFGNYIPDLNGVNGNVFQWVTPVNGVMQGSYDAAQFLVTPKTQTIMTLGADYAVSKNTSMSLDLAKSHYDVNTLSSIGKGSDDGVGAKFLLKNTQSVSKGLQLLTNLGYEYVQANFQPLERLRPVEFYRDWGLSLAVAPADEKLYNAGFQLSDKKLNTVKYDIARYDRSDGFSAIRNSIVHNQVIHGWNIKDQFSITNSDSTNFTGIYLRPSLDISRKLSFLGNYLVGAGYSMEHNEDKDKAADTVTSTSFAFQTFNAYFKSPEKNPNRWGMNFATRDNSYAHGNELALGDRSKTVSLFVDLTKNPHNQFHINATYRKLQIVDSAITTQTADNSVLGRAEYLVNEWKGLVKGNMLFEVGSGQQQELSYTYLQVPAGTGQYTWIDNNKDGVQQLSEFVLAQFQDQATYIRVYTPSDTYIKANYNTFNYSFTINPKSAINPAKSSQFEKVLSRMMLQTTLQLTQKEEAKGFIQLNPFKAPLDDTSLITRALVMVNSFSFNRSDPHWGFDVSNTRNGAKTLLTYGYESRQLNEWTIRSRIIVNRNVALTTTLKQGTNELTNSSSNFDSSNYHLQQFSIEPDLTYTQKSNLRIEFGYKLSSKLNSPMWGGQQYTSGAVNTEFKYNILQSTSIQGKFTINSISYAVKDGTVSLSSPVAYTILEGLSPGKNYLWSLDFTKKLGSSLEISLQYEGRKAGDANVINTGRASLRALL
jgi:hypothetical protein